jgi:branched-chain amino acid transport system ATP-binding protein
MATPALEITNLHAWYGESHILHDLNISVNQGEVVTLLGRNGAGRTTTLRAIMGLTGARKGSIKVNGTEAINLPTYKIAHLGVGYCPEERGIFSSLSAEENLLLPPPVSKTDKGMSIEEIYDMFPNLKERAASPGTRLSGGEQQMLAIGRAMMNHPRLLMLDEPVEGLAPVIVEEIVAQLKVIKAAGVPILLVEQNLEVCTQLADRHVIIEQGRVVYTGSNDAFRADEAVKDRYLGVGLAA